MSGNTHIARHWFVLIRSVLAELTGLPWAYLNVPNTRRLLHSVVSVSASHGFPDHVLVELGSRSLLAYSHQRT